MDTFYVHSTLELGGIPPANALSHVLVTNICTKDLAAAALAAAALAAVAAAAGCLPSFISALGV